ncbi:MAG: aminotransferase class I/II-fold pyridoxal phosphate-dependent enzyme [Lachnospiraceae bacterium]|nr:aminotransferase class I/II-fold pyridoxal phosphate-dependent enzyme [Lachnospiraceae bacterium]
MAHKHGGDIYTHSGVKDFSANINFRGMPSVVREAARNAVDASVHYPDPDCRMLKSALAAREHVLPEHIICGNGAAELMFALANAVRPKRALIAVPSFFEYEQSLEGCGCEIERFLLSPKEEFRLDERLLREAVLLSEHTYAGEPVKGKRELLNRFHENAEQKLSEPYERWRAMIILGNPNNPTGRVIETDVLWKLIRVCLDHRILLVLDESFMDFLDAEDRKETFSATILLSECPNVFIIRSFTKMYAIPGIRFGYGMCSERKLLEQMRQLLQPWNVSVVAQEAATAAASEVDFALETAAQISVNRNAFADGLRDAGVRVFPSSANFLLICGPEDLGKHCLEKGFLIRDCGNFPGLERAGDGRAYFRVCVRSFEENEELLKVMCSCCRD